MFNGFFGFLLSYPSFLSTANIFVLVANATLGSSLSSCSNNASWLSPSGDFAFGFHQLNNSDLFLLAIWFNKIPKRSIVWHANGDKPAPRGSTLELSASGLLLRDPRGQAIWNARSDKYVVHAAMLGTGNFVLKASGKGSNYVWQSLENLTDTILPTQILDLGSVLISRLTETNFYKGRFELRFSNGSLQLIPVAWPSRSQYKSYYTSNTYGANSYYSGNWLVFNGSANIYIVRNNGQIVQLPKWSRLYPRLDHYFEQHWTLTESLQNMLIRGTLPPTRAGGLCDSFLATCALLYFMIWVVVHVASIATRHGPLKFTA